MKEGVQALERVSNPSGRLAGLGMLDLTVRVRYMDLLGKQKDLTEQCMTCEALLCSSNKSRFALPPTYLRSTRMAPLGSSFHQGSPGCLCHQRKLPTPMTSYSCTSPHLSWKHSVLLGRAMQGYRHPCSSTRTSTRSVVGAPVAGAR